MPQPIASALQMQMCISFGGLITRHDRENLCHLPLLLGAGELQDGYVSEGVEGVQEVELEELGHAAPDTAGIAADNAHQLRVLCQPLGQPE